MESILIRHKAQGSTVLLYPGIDVREVIDVVEAKFGEGNKVVGFQTTDGMLVSPSVVCSYPGLFSGVLDLVVSEREEPNQGLDLCAQLILVRRFLKLYSPRQLALHLSAQSLPSTLSELPFALSGQQELSVSAALLNILELFTVNANPTRSFLAAMYLMCGGDTDERLWLGWKLFDSDDDGSLTESELTEFLRALLFLSHVALLGLSEEDAVHSSSSLQHRAWDATNALAGTIVSLFLATASLTSDHRAHAKRASLSFDMFARLLADHKDVRSWLLSNELLDIQGANTVASTLPSTAASSSDSASVPNAAKWLQFLSSPEIRMLNRDEQVAFMISKGLSVDQVVVLLDQHDQEGLPTESEPEPPPPLSVQAEAKWLAFLRDPDVRVLPADTLESFLSSQGLSDGQIHGLFEQLAEPSSESEDIPDEKGWLEFLTHPQVLETPVEEILQFILARGLSHPQIMTLLSKFGSLMGRPSTDPAAEALPNEGKGEDEGGEDAPAAPSLTLPINSRNSVAFRPADMERCHVLLSRLSKVDRTFLVETLFATAAMTTTASASGAKTAPVSPELDRRDFQASVIFSLDKGHRSIFDEAKEVWSQWLTYLDTVFSIVHASVRKLDAGNENDPAVAPVDRTAMPCERLVTMLLPLCQGTIEDKLALAFSLFDRKHKGHLSVVELFELLLTFLTAVISHSSLYHVLSSLPKSIDGVVDMANDAAFEATERVLSVMTTQEPTGRAGVNLATFVTIWRQSPHLVPWIRMLELDSVFGVESGNAAAAAAAGAQARAHAHKRERDRPSASVDELESVTPNPRAHKRPASTAATSAVAELMKLQHGGASASLSASSAEGSEQGEPTPAAKKASTAETETILRIPLAFDDEENLETVLVVERGDLADLALLRTIGGLKDIGTQQVYSQFHAQSARQQEPNVALTLAGFDACLRSLIPGLVAGTLSSAESANLFEMCHFLFNLFDVERTGKVDFAELTFSFSLICGGDQDVKLALGFLLFDSDNDGHLTPAECYVFLRCILAVFFATNRCSRRVGTSDLCEVLSQQSRLITLELFKMLVIEAATSGQTVEDGNGSPSTQTGKKISHATFASLESLVPCLQFFSLCELSDKFSGIVRDESFLHGDDDTPAAAASHATTATTSFATPTTKQSSPSPLKHPAAFASFLNMGHIEENRQRLRNGLGTQLQPKSILEVLRKVATDDELEKMNLVRAFDDIIPQATDMADRTFLMTSIDNLFNAYDLDKCDSVDLAEFTTGLCLISSGHREDKLKFIFSLFDLDTDGQLSGSELFRCFRSLLKALTVLSRETGSDGYDKAYARMTPRDRLKAGSRDQAHLDQAVFKTARACAALASELSPPARSDNGIELLDLSQFLQLMASPNDIMTSWTHLL